MPRILAIVPAAGRARRMGRSKQLLPVAGRPMLVDVVESLAAAAVTGVVIVTHADVAAAISEDLPDQVAIALNDDPHTEMIDSIRIGLDAWDRRVGITAGDGVLIMPSDQPGVPPRDVDACIAVFEADPTCIVVASQGGKRGHPMIFPGVLAETVRSERCGAGLRQLLDLHGDCVRLVECASAAVVRNINTPADFEGLA